MKVYHHPKVSTVWGILDRDYCFIRGWENSFPPYNITASCFMYHKSTADYLLGSRPPALKFKAAGHSGLEHATHSITGPISSGYLNSGL